jgi:very-short-patch-repair endonuclease
VAPAKDPGRPGATGERKPAPDAARQTYLVAVLGRRHELEVSGPRERRIAAIATVQRGRISYRQLLAAGIGKTAILGLVERGGLFPHHRGVYVVGHEAAIELGDETAALLAVHDRAALSHHSAGMLWKLVPSGSGDGLIHVLVRGRSRGRPDGVLVHRTSILTRADVRLNQGLPVTSPAWTLLELAELVSERELELAFDRALVSRIVAAQEIAEVLKRADGRIGRRALQRLVERERGPARTRSEAEQRFLALIHSARLPEPMVNARIHGYEVDFLWPGRLIVEIDGFRFHSTRRAFEHDHRKDAVLRGLGLAVARFTWEQITDQPTAVVALVAQALAPVNGS